MKRFSSILFFSVLLAAFGWHSYVSTQLRDSVVFQDSETLKWSIAIEGLQKDEISRRILRADPVADAQRAYSIWDRRLVGINAHIYAEIPGLQPDFPLTRSAIRLKLLAVPDDDRLRQKARFYCAQYNAQILAKFTEWSPSEAPDSISMRRTAIAICNVR